MQAGAKHKPETELELKKLQLHWLLQITKAINYNLPVSSLFEIYATVLRDHLKIQQFLLFVNEGSWLVRASSGLTGEINVDDTGSILRDISRFSEGADHGTSWLKQFETIIPVYHKDNILAYALIGGLNESGFPSRNEIVTYIHTITNVIVVAIENKRLAKESIRQAALERELELAAQMQSMLFPASLVTHSFLDIAATYIPHQSVGGDYYDFIPLNEHEALVCMADVSGKGLSAAMLMSNFQANLHALIKHTGFTLTNLVHELNACVNRSARGEKFITFFIALINRHDGKIRYINAGHNPPILLHGDSLTALQLGTTGLGMFDELPFLNTGEADFPQGSLLFCYTDGITDMENHMGTTFGFEQLAGLLTLHRQVSTMQHLHEVMVRSFDEFRGENSYPDDVTFLSIRFN